ncbi:mechanosensitive ion channel family protein [Flexithrix dorotheae]|uniref:mechanosensitive ion channel family protein n=1 Tax=Flexithrix dorotheae TaxID=70993 RepID=UPI00037B36A4|nr:mechanosensitive ion channel domain-containing protein [Flexithrix dorotheae]
MENFDVNTSELMNMALEYAPKLALAILTLLIGFPIINSIIGMLTKVLKKRNVDESLVPFLRSILGVLLKAMLLISVASMVGIETTSFVAVIGAAGLAIGLALQGSLSNFAGGVLILLFKPYKVGDVIDAQGFIGKVHEIQVFNTIMKTPDNKTIIIPNGPLAGGSITNFSTEATRRVDFTFGIGYGDDIAKAKQVLRQIIDEDDRIMKDPEPFIAVSELADSSVNFAVRVWCNAAEYWNIYFDMQEKVKVTFDKEGINIPFPQMDAHIYNHSS